MRRAIVTATILASGLALAAVAAGADRDNRWADPDREWDQGRQRQMRYERIDYDRSDPQRENMWRYSDSEEEGRYRSRSDRDRDDDIRHPRPGASGWPYDDDRQFFEERNRRRESPRYGEERWMEERSRPGSQQWPYEEDRQFFDERERERRAPRYGREDWQYEGDRPGYDSPRIYDDGRYERRYR